MVTFGAFLYHFMRHLSNMYFPVGIINRLSLGNLGVIFSCDEIIVRQERLKHISVNHPQDIELFLKFAKICIEEPDIVFLDLKHDQTVFMIKRLKDTNVNTIVRLVLQDEKKNLKSSVMTFYRIRDRNLKKLINTHKILYMK